MEGTYSSQKSKGAVKSCFDKVDRLNCKPFASDVCNFTEERGEKMRTKKRSGFSMIEILIVMGVLGFLAALFTI